MEILKRFAVKVKSSRKKATSKVIDKAIAKTEYTPKTVGHFLEVSKTLSAWSEEDIKRLEENHILFIQFALLSCLLCKGSTTRTRAPDGSICPRLKLPPNACARSRMPNTPKWPGE